MMRNLKFRSWHDGKMCPVCQLQFDETGQNLDFLEIITDLDKRIVYHFPASGLATNPLMQFTGLLDKKGKEIYEDDICTATNRMMYSKINKSMVPARYKVYWRDDRWHLIDNNGDDYHNDDYYQSDEIGWNEIEVIGNVHENPDLLQGATA
jgi:uncharacterized phage protein (TIGR01671 family)